MKTSAANKYECDLQDDLDLDIITPKEIAAIFGKSVAWVYRHPGDLGAIEIGGSYIFTKEGIKNAIEEGKKLARKNHGRPAGLHKRRIPDKERCPKMGTRQKRSDTTRERAVRLGLAIVSS